MVSRPELQVVTGADYEQTGHFGLTRTLGAEDGTQGADILRQTYVVAAKAGPISIDPSDG